jgi:hypothetical protein
MPSQMPSQNAHRCVTGTSGFRYIALLLARRFVRVPIHVTIIIPVGLGIALGQRYYV